jgi:hypothetical protein
VFGVLIKSLPLPDQAESHTTHGKEAEQEKKNDDVSSSKGVSVPFLAVFILSFVFF